MASGPSSSSSSGLSRNGAGNTGINVAGGTGGGEATHQVADLNPYVNKYNIKVSKLKSFHKCFVPGLALLQALLVPVELPIVTISIKKTHYR
jgi:hypothetical protein